MDAANMYMRCLHVAPYDPTDDNFTIYKCLLMQSLKTTLQNFNNIDRVIICQEGFKNWRKEVYPLYKANRVEGREASIIDFDKFYEVNNKFIKDFANIAQNFQFLQVPNCEADDLIASITKYKQDVNIIVQSSDRDFYQLFKYNNYKQWDAIKKQYISVVDPENYLTEKIILGDAGDNVPRISGLKYRQGPKFIEKNVLPDLDKWLTETDCKDEWERNYKLIAFDAIPEELSSAIVEQVNTWQKGKFDARAYYNFMLDNKMASQIDFVTDYINAFSKC